MGSSPAEAIPMSEPVQRTSDKRFQVEYWKASCPSCQWTGLSRDCAGGNQIADTGDYDDVRCPECFHVVEEAK